MTITKRLSDLIFGDSTAHPLELDESEHRDKQVELDHKRTELTARRDDLQERRAELRAEYLEAREDGDEDRAEQALREAERVDDRLETVEGKLDVVDQMSRTVSNFLNVYEMRDLRDDAYWERLLELDRDELVEAFSRESVTIEDVTERLETAGTAASGVVSTFSESAARLHGDSEIRAEFEAAYDGAEATATHDPESVFENVEADLDEDDVADLHLA